MDDIKKLVKKCIAYVILYIFLLIVCLLVCILIHLAVEDPPGAFTTGRETFFVNDQFIGTTQFYQGIENIILGDIRTVLAGMREKIVFHSYFRTLAIMLATLAMVLMGFSMLTGEHKITVKEFSIDIFIIFGTVSLLLSESAIMYIDLLYNAIVDIANWVMIVFTKTIFGVTDIAFLKGETQDVNIYAPLDIVASIFFDPAVSKKVQQKLAGLLFSGYIHFVPVIAIVMLVAFISTITVFLAFLIAKVTILMSLQILPFFILLASVNDVKIKFTKKGKSKSYLWALIEIGILKSWVYLALMSAMAAVLYYVLVISAIENLLDFPVRVPNDSLRQGISLIPFIGGILSRVIHNSHPSALGVEQSVIAYRVLVLIVGMIAFKQAFTIMTGLINSISFEPKEGVMQNLFSGKGGIFDKTNHIGSMIEPMKSYVGGKILRYTTGFSSTKENFRHLDNSLLGLAKKAVSTNYEKKAGSTHFNAARDKFLANKLKGRPLGNIMEQKAKFAKERADFASRKRDILAEKNEKVRNKKLDEYTKDKDKHLKERLLFEKQNKEDLKKLALMEQGISKADMSQIQKEAEVNAKKAYQQLQIEDAMKQANDAEEKKKLEQMAKEEQEHKQKEQETLKEKQKEEKQKQEKLAKEEADERKRIEKAEKDEAKREEAYEKDRLEREHNSDNSQEAKRKAEEEARRKRLLEEQQGKQINAFDFKKK